MTTKTESLADGQVPVFENLPSFEEEQRLAAEPDPVVRAALDGRSPSGEQFRLLAARVRALGRDKRLRRLGVVSATPDEGRTTVSLGLAGALAADRQRRVLLLELDLRRPSLDSVLGLAPPRIGLGQYVQRRGETPLLRRPVGDGFWLLSAGSRTLDTLDVLRSPRLATLLEAADRVFDFVVVDCPPLLPVPELATAQDLIDGFVFVVRPRHSLPELIRQAVSLLRPEAVTGLVLNAHRAP